MHRGGARKGRPKPPGSGRTKGTFNKLSAPVRELAQAYGPEAIEKLVDLMRHAEQQAVQRSAASELLDRAYGRPVQAIAGETGTGPAVVRIIHQYLDETREPPTEPEDGTAPSA